MTVNVRYTEGQFGPRAGYVFTFMKPAPREDGRFRVEGLIPGVAYDLGVLKDNFSLFEFDRPAKGLKLQAR